MAAQAQNTPSSIEATRKGGLFFDAAGARAYNDCMKTTRTRQQAFTLVELSLVLVIVGILTGGILAGQSIISASRLRNISSDFQTYATAANAFSDKYKAIPGDFAGGTEIWGRMYGTGSCVTWSNDAVNSVTGVCDGNGSNNLTYPGAATDSGELFQFWRELAVAGFISGTYSGLAGTGGVAHCSLGTNCPASRLENAGFGASSEVAAADGSSYAINKNNFFVFGLATTTSLPTGKALTPEEASSIDLKLDDGKPAFGNVVARYWNDECATADDGTSAADDLAAHYNQTVKTAQCALFFINAF